MIFLLVSKTMVKWYLISKPNPCGSAFSFLRWCRQSRSVPTMTGRVICQLGWLQVQVHHEAIPINRTFGRAWAGEPSLINATAHQGHGNPVKWGWEHIYSMPLVFFVGAGLLHLCRQKCLGKARKEKWREGRWRWGRGKEDRNFRDIIFKNDHGSFIALGEQEVLIDSWTRVKRPREMQTVAQGTRRCCLLCKGQTAGWIHQNVNQTKKREHTVLDHTADMKALPAASPWLLPLDRIPAVHPDLLLPSYAPSLSVICRKGRCFSTGHR